MIAITANSAQLPGADDSDFRDDVGDDVLEYLRWQVEKLHCTSGRACRVESCNSGVKDWRSGARSLRIWEGAMLLGRR
jgi:hypothetical protein